MTGIPIVDDVFNFINFVKGLADIGIVVFVALLLVAVTGFFAGPYSGWGLFVARYVTGSDCPWGRNLMGIWAMGLIICVILRFALPELGVQTSSRFP